MVAAVSSTDMFSKGFRKEPMARGQVMVYLQVFCVSVHAIMPKTFGASRLVTSTSANTAGPLLNAGGTLQRQDNFTLALHQPHGVYVPGVNSLGIRI